uniref:Cuticle protein 6 n=1 Tax=Blaberus craniifer TaxID=6982 RepID=CUO6_BLACR|nr:RecName: Full=Cuticle protein 6; AltName: Full=BcNCP14.9 [Blaberus craniifer]
QYVYPVLPYAPIHHYTVPVQVSTQYHAQDILGQFAFHHAGDNQVRTETKSFDGSVRGLYGYVDPTGKLVNVHYVADSNGFRVVGANNLPEAPSAPAVPDVKGPEPVQDTPEVVAARAAFQKSYDEAAQAAAVSPDVQVS